MLTESDWEKLLQDRISFKLYDAERHLDNLINYDKEEKINDTFQIRVKWECEIEAFLSQLIGVTDALLMRVNEKLGLGIDPKDVNLGSINSALNGVGKGGVLDDLNKIACSKGSWYWLINDLRNIASHRDFLRIHIDMSHGRHISFVNDPEKLDIIVFLQDKLSKMKALIENIMSNNNLA